MSLEKRETMRPMGVVSKNASGACITRATSWSCILRAARNEKSAIPIVRMKVATPTMTPMAA